MDWAQWIATVLAALVGSVVGSLSMVGVEWLHHRAERSTRRRERRDDFQQTTILELQEAVSRVIDAYVEARNAPGAFADPEGTIPMRADRVAAVASAIDRIALLGARVDDRKLRLIVEDLAASTYGLGRLGKEAYDQRWTRVHTKLVTFHHRAGELIRSL